MYQTYGWQYKRLKININLQERKRRWWVNAHHFLLSESELTEFENLQNAECYGER